MNPSYFTISSLFQLPSWKIENYFAFKLQTCVSAVKTIFKSFSGHSIFYGITKKLVLFIKILKVTKVENKTQLLFYSCTFN